MEQDYVNDSPREYGNFSVSMLNWATAFSADDENFVNDVFQQVLTNRPLISARLAATARLALWNSLITVFISAWMAVSPDR